MVDSEVEDIRCVTRDETKDSHCRHQVRVEDRPVPFVYNGCSMKCIYVLHCVSRQVYCNFYSFDILCYSFSRQEVRFSKNDF